MAEKNVLDDLSKKNFFDEIDLNILLLCSRSRAPEIRSYVAELLIMSNSDISKTILLELAKDTDDLVRINAYDSLCIFAEEDVLYFLFEKIAVEKNETAKAYIVLSLTDILVNLPLEPDRFIKYFKMMLVDSSVFVCIAIYRFFIFMGEKDFLNVLMEYINYEDYHIRIFVISVLKEILCDENKDKIFSELKKRKINEDSLAVLDSINKIIRT